MRNVMRYLVPLIAIAAILAACGPTAAPAPTAEPTQAAAPEATTATEAQPTAEPTAVSEPTAVAEPAARKSITVQQGANDPHSIDPQQAIDARDMTLTSHLFPSVTIQDPETNDIEPGMATEWEISDDGLTYTFHLLENVPWVRYNPDTGAVEEVTDESGNVRYVTAADFVYGFQRALDPATTSPAAYILAPYIQGGVEFNAGTGSADDLGLRAADDYTFEVTSPEKVGFALGIYSIINARATPQWAVEDSAEVWTEPENIATYGPYALQAWEHEASMTFVKNPFWPGSEGIRQPPIDEIVFRFIDEAVGLRDYEAGTLSVTTVPSDQIARLQSDATLGQQLKIVPGQCTQAWGFNATTPPFDNVHIRRAFNYAVDRETLVRDVLGGGEIPAAFFTPPSITLAPAGTDAVAQGVVFDAAKAQEELQLGLTDMGLASAADLPAITVEFGTSPVLSAVAQALQAMWQQTLGVQVELSQIDNTVYWSKQEQDPGQIFRAGWCPDYNDTNNYLSDVYRSDSIYNYGKWTHPDYDPLVDEARVETDLATRLDLYTQAEILLNVDDAGTMSLYYPVVAQLTQPNVERTHSINGAQAFWDWDVVE